MTPLCTLLVNYNTESEIPWAKRSAISDPINQKEEIFIKAGKFGNIKDGKYRAPLADFSLCQSFTNLLIL